MNAKLGSRFAKLWSAGVAANISDGIMVAALPLLVATLTRDPLLVALATMAYRMPWIVFELFAGELVDRNDRRHLMLIGDLARAAGVGLIAVLVATDQITLQLVYVIAFGLGVAETLVDTSWEALVPMIVEPEQLEIANGRSQAAEWTANELVGPPLGGVLFATAAAAPFGVVGVGFVLAALFLAWIPGVYRSDREVAHGRGSMRREIGEGIRWLWNHKVLRVLSLTAATTNLMVTAMFAVFVLFAQEILSLGDAGFGVLLATAGVGGIVGAVSAHTVEARVGTGTLLASAVAGIGLVSLVIALTSNPAVVGVGLAVEGFCIAMWNVVVVSLRQTITPNDLRGRVAADARVLAFGALPIGALVGGLLAEWAGLRAPFYLAAAVFAVALLAITRVVSNDGIADLRARAAAEAAPDR